MAKLQIQIVTWNHRRYLKRLFESLRAQTFRDFNIVMIDNASSDQSVEFVHEEFPEVMTLKNSRNLGFTGGHNQGIMLALAHWPEETWDTHFVLVLNPDIVATPTFLAELMREADRASHGGSFGGKLLKMFEVDGEDRELEQMDRSHVLDSTGLVRHKNGRITDRGAGETDEGQYDAGPVFGISGAAVLVRASALRDVRDGDDFFDSDFFAYKEDADLAWRLTHAGWKNIYVPSAVAYHYRGTFGKEKVGWLAAFKNRQRKSPLVAFYSYRNHLMMLVKNETWSGFLKRAPHVVPYEAAKFVALLFTETRVFFSSLASFLRHVPAMFAKRRRIQLRRILP